MIVRMEGRPVWSETLDTQRVLCVWDTEKKRQKKLGKSGDSNKSQPCLLDTLASVLTNMKPKAQLKHLQVWDIPSPSYFWAGQPPRLSIALLPCPFLCLEESERERGGRENHCIWASTSSASGLLRKTKWWVVQSCDNEQLLWHVCPESMQNYRCFRV